MKHSETIVSKRLRQMKWIGVLLLCLVIARVGYMKLLYTSEFAVQKKQAVETAGTSLLIDFENHLDLTGFYPVSQEELLQQSKKDPSMLSLLAHANTSCKPGCEGMPLTFIKDKKAYILYEDLTGTKNMIQLQKNKKEWKELTHRHIN